MENNFKALRHRVGMEKGEFAVYLGIAQSHYSKWENQKMQPDRDSMIAAWLKLKELLPGLNLQDLVKLPE